MFRELMGNGTSEIYKFSEEVKRGSVVVKDLTTKTAKKADKEGVEIYFADFDYQPTGVYSDMEVSDYTAEADTIKKDGLGLLKKYIVGSQIATDQVDGVLTAGDYVVAGTSDKVGMLIKAVSTNVSVLKYVGEYNDAGNKLYAFEIVNPHTVA